VRLDPHQVLGVKDGRRVGKRDVSRGAAARALPIDAQRVPTASG
jgi:hypothetical protein